MYIEKNRCFKLQTKFCTNDKTTMDYILVYCGYKFGLSRCVSQSNNSLVHRMVENLSGEMQCLTVTKYLFPALLNLHT